jgi:hypothetical protein
VAQNFEELNYALSKYIGINDKYKDFFVVINDYPWESIENEDMRGYTENMHVKTVFLNNELQKKVDIIIPKKELLPDAYISDEPKAYFLVPLHFQGASFGYTITDFYPGGTITEFFEFMHISICNAMEHMRSAKRNAALIDSFPPCTLPMYLQDLKTVTVLSLKHIVCTI